MSGHSFLLVLITTNYSECHGSDYIPLTPLTVNGTGAYVQYVCKCICTTVYTCTCTTVCVHVKHMYKLNSMRPLPNYMYINYYAINP